MQWFYGVRLLAGWLAFTCLWFFALRKNRNERHSCIAYRVVFSISFLFQPKKTFSSNRQSFHAVHCCTFTLSFRLQPAHIHMHTYTNARVVDSELNVHLSQVYSCWWNWMVHEGATFMITYSFFLHLSSSLSLGLSCSVSLWMVLCLRSTSPMHSLNRPFTCTCTLALIYAQLIVAVAAAVAVRLFFSFLPFIVLTRSHNKTMRDDGKQWRSFTMRSAHT